MYKTYLYFLNEMEKSPNEVYQMGNEELADYCYPHIKEKYPKAVLFKRNGIQYFALTSKAKRKLKKKLEGLKTSLIAEASAVEEFIRTLEV